METDPQTAGLESARLDLARLHACAGQSLRDVWLQLAQIAAEALGVERVGVWTLLDEERALRCRYLLQRTQGVLFQGAVLRARNFPTYFEEMGIRRAIVANDALDSPATNELRDAYLAPLGITSMLDAPFFLEGRICGIVCHEHIGKPRTWREAECAFASAVADNIARLYGEHERHHAESALEAYQGHLMELRRMEAVGRMAAGIAHDFRGIAGAALGFAELIRRVPNLPEQADHHAERVIEALERGRRLTRQVLSFGKDDPTSPRVLDVASSMECLATMLRMLLGEKIRLTLQLDQTVSRVFMDAAQLERTMLNLVLNARDAMPEGGELKIAVQDVDAEQDGEQMTYVRVSVSDTGCGMTEETRAKALTPFFTTKGEQGTGLGLVIVDQIVSRCGGHVTLESELDRGTTVHVHLPRIACSVTSTLGRDARGPYSEDYPLHS